MPIPDSHSSVDPSKDYIAVGPGPFDPKHFTHAVNTQDIQRDHASNMATLQEAIRHRMTRRALLLSPRQMALAIARYHLSIRSGMADTDTMRTESQQVTNQPGAGNNRHSLHRLVGLPPVLDACCGSRMMWYDKHDPRALYVDNRRETHTIDIGTPGTIGRSPIVVNPDMVADFTDLPFPDYSFALVVFDPPHIERTAAKGLLTKKYGHLTGDWRNMLRLGFAECFRVLRPDGTLIFKWSESEYPVTEILKLTPEKPLFGHKSGKAAGTHWIAFVKPNNRQYRKQCSGDCVRA